jgi:hypothetical protein
MVLLVNCTNITMDKIQFVERGMSSKRLLTMLEATAYTVFTVVDPEDGHEYQVQMFFMEIGTVTNYEPGYFIGDEYMPGFTYTSAAHESFAFLFFEDSLLFWGFFHEFARSNDQLIRRLAPIIIEGHKRRLRIEWN